MNAGALGLQAIRAAQVGAIEVGVVAQLARFGRTGIEPLGGCLVRRSLVAPVSQSLNVAISAGGSRGETAAQGGLGSVFRATGDLARAHAAYAAALRLAERRVPTDPANSQ
jgi:hypothetical protein